MKILLNVIMKMLWVICIIVIILGVLYSISVMEKTDNVMQQIYALAFAMTFAIVPYCLCRSIQMIFRHDESLKGEKAKKLAEKEEITK